MPDDRQPAHHGVLLYGAPATGKDTVTAALTDADPRFVQFERLKAGPGRTTGYRMTTQAELDELRERPGSVLWENSRYDARYVTDREHLDELLAAGRIPVIHLGQAEAVSAITALTPHVTWLVVELRCPRDVAEQRITARDTGDTVARLVAFDKTTSLDQADLTISTDLTAPDIAARSIAAAVTGSPVA